MNKATVASILVAMVLLAVAVIAEAQPKVLRIGFLFSLSTADHASNMDVFRGGLRELGYVEGKNIFIEYRSAEGKPDRLPPWLTSWSVSRLT